MESEESFVYSDVSGLELELDLSLCCGKANQCPRILTAKEFDSVVSVEVSSSSSSSSVTAGTKRSSGFPSSPPPRKVIGWPPVRSYRMNTLVNNGKTKEFLNNTEDRDNINRCLITKLNVVSNEKHLPKMSSFVKVTMDGVSIGRKVDLLAHNSYKALALSLDEMFLHGARKSDKLCDYVMTYEDKDGDWMLVGDVPWEMFLNTVKRLRIMRSAEAKGINSSASAVGNGIRTQ